MSHNSDSSGRHRPALDGPGQVVYIVTLALMSWGVLAFGSPYPWAYIPLAIGSALVGLLAWFASRPTRLLRDQRRLLIAIACVALVAFLQFLPLPARVVDTISPSNATLLRQVNITFASLSAAGDAQVSASRPLSVDPPATILAVLLLAAFALLLAGLLRHCNRFGAKRYAGWFVGFGVILAVIGIVQKALLGDNVAADMKIYGFWTPMGKLATPFGPFVNKNHFAGWMLMALPTALGYLFAQADIGFRHARPGWRYRLLWLSSPEGGRMQIAAFAVVVMGVSLVMTLSRSGMACFGMAMAIATIAAVRQQSTLRARLGVVLALGVLLAAPVLWAHSNVAERLTTQNSSFGMRRLIWADTLRVMRDFPLTGTGLNTYAVAMEVYQSGHEQQVVLQAHDDYLQLASEGGVLVGVPIAATLLLLTLAIWRRFSAGEDEPATAWIRFGAATGVAAIAMQSLVEFSLQMPGNAVSFIVLLAIVLHRPSSATLPTLRRV
jgi:O-antigen ligase